MEQGATLMPSTSQIVEQSQRIGIQFLFADLTVAHTFLDVAEVTQSEQSRKRNRMNARTAYEMVLHFLPRVSPSDEEYSALEDKLRKLKERLVALGYESSQW
jgi:hypothetical protein